LSQLPFSASAGENEEERGVFGHTYRSSCGKGKRKTEKRKEKYLSQLLYRIKEWSEKYIRRSRQLRSQFSLLLLLLPPRPSVSLYILLLSRRVSPADTLSTQSGLFASERDTYI
jgi:hypothetical protein